MYKVSEVNLTPSLSKRKMILKQICKSQIKWKLMIVISILLYYCSISIIIGSIILLIRYPTTILMSNIVFICYAISIGCVPFFIACSVKNTANYECGFPYSSYANGTLLLNEQSLEYIFWRVEPHEPAAYGSKRAVYRDEDKFVYKIDKQAISKLSINELGICSIKGQGLLEKPEWACVDYKKYSDKIESCKNFSFILSFEEAEASEKIKRWSE